MKIPFKVMTTSALTTMTVVSGLGLNSLSANASSLSSTVGDKSDTALIAQHNYKVAHSKYIAEEMKKTIEKESKSTRAKYLAKVNHIVRDDNVNYTHSSILRNVTPDYFTQWNLDSDVVGHAMAGSKAYQQDLANDFATLDTQTGETALNYYNYLRSEYLHENKTQPFVTATRAGNVYKDVKLTKKTGKHFKEDDLFQVQAIYSVNGKQRFKLADGNYISGYHAVINRDFTSNSDEVRLFDRVVYVGRKSAKSLSKKYYVRTPKGHKHIAFVRKNVVKHARVNFEDFSSVKKVNHVRKGSYVHFVKVVRNGNTFRLQLTSGQYVTANKHFVKVIK